MMSYRRCSKVSLIKCSRIYPDFSPRYRLRDSTRGFCNTSDFLPLRFPRTTSMKSFESFATAIPVRSGFMHEIDVRNNRLFLSRFILTTYFKSYLAIAFRDYFLEGRVGKGGGWRPVGTHSPRPNKIPTPLQ